MLRLALVVVASLISVLPSAAAADDPPPTVTLAVNVTSYAFVPVPGVDYLIDQPSPSQDFTLTLARDDQRRPFGDKIPGWRGAHSVVLKDGYKVRVNARYLQGEPQGDFVGDQPGLALDIFFYYDKQLIGFQSATHWAKTAAAVKVAADVKDVPYFDLLSRSDFELSSVTDGYGEGFRAWTALRDGLRKRDKKDATYQTLSDTLKPLGRKDNLMIPTLTVTARVKNDK